MSWGNAIVRKIVRKGNLVTYLEGELHLEVCSPFALRCQHAEMLGCRAMCKTRRRS